MGTTYWLTNFFLPMLHLEVMGPYPRARARTPRYKTKFTSAEPQRWFGISNQSSLMETHLRERLKLFPSMYLPYFLSYWPLYAPNLGYTSQIKVQFLGGFNLITSQRKVGFG